MPKEVERKLKTIAKKRGYSADRTKRYVYGTLTKLKKSKRKR